MKSVLNILLNHSLSDLFSVRAKQYVFTLNCFIVSTLLSFGQELSTYVNHDYVQLGEPLELNLSVKLPKNSTISFKPYDKTIPAYQRKNNSQVNGKNINLEIEGEFKDSSKQDGNYITWHGRYSVVSWDTGKIIIPAQQIIINDSTYLFNEVSFSVSSNTIGKKDELFDIQEGFATIPDKPTFISLIKDYWYVATGLILLLAGFIFLLIKRKNKKQLKPQKVMSLKDRTLFAINALDAEQLWLNNKLKQHYTELSHIMRLYLSSRYNLNLLERTTNETKLLLKQTDLSADTIKTFMMILQQADMVKFAKHTTDETTVLKISLMAKQIVAETSPLEISGEELKIE